jgi:hypothetical protein
VATATDDTTHADSAIHRGQCFCGAVTVEARGQPATQGYCHCESCRSHSGALIRGFTLWPKDAVSVTGGELAGFNKMGFSDRQHCTACGGQVLIDHPTIGMIDLHASTIRDFPFQPTLHVNYQEHVLPIRDGLPKMRDMPAEVGGSGQTMPE